MVWEAWGQPDAASQRIDFVSNHIETMLGYAPAQWTSTPNFWLTIVHPDDKERAGREALAIFNGGVGGRQEFRWVTRDGRVLWVEAHSSVILDEQRRPVGMRGVTLDITGRKQLEQETGGALASASGRHVPMQSPRIVSRTTFSRPCRTSCGRP